MKKLSAMPAILATMATVSGCVPMEPMDDNDDENCTMESSMGSHVKEEVCRHDTGGSTRGLPTSERDVDTVFGDIEFERVPDPPVAEGSCGSD